MKFSLNKEHCVKRVMWYYSAKNISHTWTCSGRNCSTCQGDKCGDYTLTVYTEGASSDELPPLTGCKYGDRVLLERSSGSGNYTEIVIIAKQGNYQSSSLFYCCSSLTLTYANSDFKTLDAIYLSTKFRNTLSTKYILIQTLQ